MNPLTLSSLAPVTMQTVGALSPARMADKSEPNLWTPLNLASDSLQNNVPPFTLDPLLSPTPQSPGAPQDSGVSLLTALTAPQAAVSTTPTPDATNQTTTLQAPSTEPSAPLPPVANDVVPTQDPAAASAGLDFAQQAALRFGAGVAGSAPLAPATMGAGPILVRDASSVVRNGGLQAHTGAPGPEAFILLKDTLDRAHKSYQANATAPTAMGLDLVG